MIPTAGSSRSVAPPGTRRAGVDGQEPRPRRPDDGPDDGPAVVRRARRWVGLLASLAVAAILRVAWLLHARPEPVSDFKQYRRLAIGLLDTGVFGPGAPSAWRLPGFPVVLAAGAAVERDPVALGVVTVLLSVVQVALTWWVALRALRSTTAATVAAGTAAVLPAFVTFAPVLASEHLLAVLVLATLGVALGPPATPGDAGRPATSALGWRGASAGGWRRASALGWRGASALGWRGASALGWRGASAGGWRRGLAAGVLLGAATLTRGEAVVYLPVVAGVLGAAAWRRTRRPSAAAGVAAVTVAGLLLVVVPWVMRNERVVGPGAGLTTTGGFNFLLAHSPDGYGWRTPLPLPLLVEDELLRDELGWRWGRQFLEERPGDLLPTTWRGTTELLGPSTYAARYATVRFDLDLRRVVARDDLRWRGSAITAAGAASPVLLLTAVAGLVLRRRWRRSAWWTVVGMVAANWVLYAVVFWAQPRYRFVVDAVACVAVGAVGAEVGRWRRSGVARRVGAARGADPGPVGGRGAP